MVVKEGREDEIINAFDPNREDQHYLTPKSLGTV